MYRNMRTDYLDIKGSLTRAPLLSNHAYYIRMNTINHCQAKKWKSYSKGVRHFFFPFQASSNELKSYHLVFSHALFLWPEMQQVVDPAQMFAGGIRVSTDMAEQYHHGYYCWCCCYSQKESLLHDLQLKRSLPLPFHFVV